jgi:transcription factor Dp-1
VADELVAEVLTPQVDSLTGELQPPDCQYDEKNIRRRVYDALNVLMAMDIISKEKKEIRWKGLPSHAQPDLDLEVLQRDKRRLEQSLQRKREHLQELIMQRIAFQRLIRRNTAREEAVAAAAAAAAAAHSQAAAAGPGAGPGLGMDEEARKIPLPFIIINTGSQTVIQCEMTEDRSDVFFNFSAPFEINDDNEVLKRMELQRVTPEEVLAYVAPELQRYVPADVYRQPQAQGQGQGQPLGAAAVAGGLDAAYGAL